MAKIQGTIIVDVERCKGCGVCTQNCPVKTLTLSERVNSKGYNYCQFIDPDKCIGCAGCAIVCPDSIITVYRQKIEN